MTNITDNTIDESVLYGHDLDDSEQDDGEEELEVLTGRRRKKKDVAPDDYISELENGDEDELDIMDDEKY